MATNRIEIFVSGNAPDYPHHKGDAGYDIRSMEDLTIEPMSTAPCGTGVRMAIPPNLVCILKERSGNALKGISVGGGVIDSSYRGEVKVILRNLTGSRISIKNGDKIAQAVFVELPEVRFTKVESLPESGRGEDGFGSTDNKD